MKKWVHWYHTSRQQAFIIDQHFSVPHYNMGNLKNIWGLWSRWRIEKVKPWIQIWPIPMQKLQESNIMGKLIKLAKVINWSLIISFNCYSKWHCVSVHYLLLQNFFPVHRKRQLFKCKRSKKYKKLYMKCWTRYSEVFQVYVIQ